MPKTAGERHHPYHGSFENLRFSKKGASVIEKARLIRERLALEIVEHAGAVGTLADHYGISSASEVLLQLEARSGGYASPLPEAFINEVRTHVQARHQKLAEAEKLRLIIDNLDPDGLYDLNFEELRFFEF